MVYDLNKIKYEIQDLPNWEDQICLQGTKTIKDPYAGIGSARDLPEKEIEFKYPLFDFPYLNSIIEEHNLHRVRLMNLKSKTCYSYHKDQGKRFHIPIITNENCFFVVDEEIKRFFDSVREGNADLTLITEKVISYLKEESLLDKLIIRSKLN